MGKYYLVYNVHMSRVTTLHPIMVVVHHHIFVAARHTSDSSIIGCSTYQQFATHHKPNLSVMTDRLSAVTATFPCGCCVTPDYLIG
jgi:hypothetical protein